MEPRLLLIGCSPQAGMELRTTRLKPLSYRPAPATERILSDQAGAFAGLNLR